MFLRLTVGLLCLLVLGYASRTLQEYLFDSTQKGQADAVAMHTLIAGAAEAPAAGGTALPSGELAVAPSAPGAAVVGTTGARIDPELAVLDPTRMRFAGRVLAAGDSRPLAGVRIEREESLLAESDAEGRFQVVVPSHAAFAMSVVADGYGPAYVFVDTPARGDTGERTIELQPAAQLEGRVLDSSGTPRGGVRVVVTARAELLETSTLEDPVAQRRRIHPPDPRWEALSNARGEVRMNGLPPGVPLSLSLWEAGVENPGVRTPLVVRATTSDPAELPAGCLLAPTRPLILSGGEAHAEEWKLDGILGRYAQRAPAVDEPPSLHAQTALRGNERTRSPSNTRHVTFQDPNSGSNNYATAIARARSLAGQILDDKGRPIDGLVVSARPTGATGLVTATSLPDGHFAVGALAEGEHDLVVYGGARFGVQSFGPFATGRDDLRLELDSGTIIAGRAVDERNGEPIQAQLSLVSCTAQACRVAAIESAADGSFSFSDLRPGNYDLVATTRDGLIALASGIVLAPAASARDLRLELRPGAELRISAHSGKLVKRAVVRSSGHGIAALELRNGIEERLLVPAGALVVRILEGAKVVEERSVEIPEGGEALVRFD